MRVHVSLNVSNVAESVKFYEQLFGTAPQKQNSNYAKFDLQDPPLNFAMQSGEGPLSQVSHFGIEADSPEEFERWHKELAEKGLVKRVEKNTDCCFARQDKAWATDPDGHAWELFYVHEQLPVTETAACCG